MMKEVVRTSVTSVSFNVTTRYYIPEDSILHTHHRENLKSHMYTYRIKSTHRLKVKKVKQSLYTPWRRLGGEEA
jgi:hypothetical protein